MYSLSSWCIVLVPGATAWWCIWCSRWSPQPKPPHSSPKPWMPPGICRKAKSPRCQTHQFTWQCRGHGWGKIQLQLRIRGRACSQELNKTWRLHTTEHRGSQHSSNFILANGQMFLRRWRRNTGWQLSQEPHSLIVKWKCTSQLIVLWRQYLTMRRMGTWLRMVSFFFIVHLCLLDYLNPGYYPKYEKEMSILVSCHTCFYRHNNVSSLAHVGLWRGLYLLWKNEEQGVQHYWRQHLWHLSSDPCWPQPAWVCWSHPEDCHWSPQRWGIPLKWHRCSGKTVWYWHLLLLLIVLSREEQTTLSIWPLKNCTMFYYATKDSIGALFLEQFRDETSHEAFVSVCAIVCSFLYKSLTLGMR